MVVWLQPWLLLVALRHSSDRQHMKVNQVMTLMIHLVAEHSKNDKISAVTGVKSMQDAYST